MFNLVLFIKVILWVNEGGSEVSALQVPSVNNHVNM